MCISLELPLPIHHQLLYLIKVIVLGYKVASVKLLSMLNAFQAEWIIHDNRPPDEWPGEGNIIVEEFDLKYREGLPLVLKQISCDIKAGEKVLPSLQKFCL